MSQATLTTSTTPPLGVECRDLVRLRWRKESIRYGPNTYRLNRGQQQLAVVQECKGGWFWYGGGRNTYTTPTDLGTAQREALAHIKSIEVNDLDHATPGRREDSNGETDSK